nr:hypothetical protein [Paenibacillus bovis]
MYLFMYEFPFYKGSTKTLHISNEEEKKVGTIERYYKHKFQKVIDRIISSDLILNVQTYDEHQEIFCNIKEDMHFKSWLRSSWQGQSRNLGNFQLFDRTKIKTHPRMELVTEAGDTYLITKNFGNRKIFITNEQEELFVEMTYEKMLPPYNIRITLLNEKLHILEVGAIHFIFNMRY